MNDAPQDASRSQNASHLHGSRPGIDRRTFLGAVGAAAAVTLLPQQPVHANQAAQDYYYQDSFGAVGPAGEGAIELGVYSPPVLAPMTVQADGSTTAATFYSPGYPQYNILMIVVDQMRNPAFWVPAANTTSTGQQIVNSSIPNISGLANTSFYFPHYFTAATICGPARACLLTGLYAQQHCLFQSSLPDTTESTPPLLPYNPAWLPGSTTENPGFPTIGNVLSQPVAANNNMSMLQYDCTWIGKWHLSCVTGTADGSNGQNGPARLWLQPDVLDSEHLGRRLLLALCGYCLSFAERTAKRGSGRRFSGQLHAVAPRPGRAVVYPNDFQQQQRVPGVCAVERRRRCLGVHECLASLRQYQPE